MGLLATSGSILANVSYGVFANYVYDYLRRKKRHQYGVRPFLPLPAETMKEVDHHVKAFTEIWFSKYIDRGSKTNDLLNKLLIQIKSDQKRVYMHSLLDAIFFDEELAVKRIADDLRMMAEKDDGSSKILRQRTVDSLAKEMVAEAVEYFSENLKDVKRIADLVKGVEKSVQALEEAEKASVSKTDKLKGYSKEYLDCIIPNFREIMISGFDAFVKNDKFTNDINQSFVSLRVEDQSDDSEFRTAEDVVESEKYVILRGNPGCGKTTLLQWLSVNHERASISHSYIPVLVPLRKLITEFDGEFALAHCFHVACPDPDVRRKIGADWLISALESQSVLLMLDGLDEVPFEHRKSFWNFVEKVKSDYPVAKIIVTSRNLYYTHDSSGHYKDPLDMSRRDYSASRHEWSPPAGFVDFQIHGLKRQDIAIFVNRWHAGIDLDKIHDGSTRDLDNTASALKDALFSGRSSESLLQLCSNPMLCALLCLVNLVEKGELPDTPKTLYRHALDILLLSRDEVRGIVTEPKFLSISKPLRQKLLEYIAFSMQEIVEDHGKADYLAEAKKADVLSWIEHYLSNDEDDTFEELSSEEILNFLVERVSVLREPTKDRVDFVHRSFMEYLAAEHFARSKSMTMIRHYAKKDQWHGTLRFLVNSDYGREATNSDIVNELLSICESSSDLSQLREFVFDMIEYLESYHTNELEAYSRIVGHLLPIEHREAHKLRKAKFSVLIEHFGIEPKSKQIFEEAAFVYLFHKSPRSKKVIENHFRHYSNRDFVVALNLARTLPIEKQNGLANCLKSEFQHGIPEGSRIDRLYCDDLVEFNRISKPVSYKTGSQYFLKMLIVDGNTRNLDDVSKMRGVIEIKIDSGFAETVRSVAQKLRDAGHEQSIIINESLDLAQFDDVGPVSYQVA